MSVWTVTDQRDRVEKPEGYAGAGIAVYLLVDRDEGSVSVYAAPEEGACRGITTRRFGTTVKIPAPVGIGLETERLKACL